MLSTFLNNHITHKAKDARARPNQNKLVFCDVNMNVRKILLLILSIIFYCFYSVHMWFTTTNNEEKPLNSNVNSESQPEVNDNKPNNSQLNVVKPKVIPLFLKDACSALEVFTQKPQTVKIKRSKYKDMDLQNNTITVIGITVFLVILVLNALIDVLKVKEEERARRKLNPDGERRQSLAEFANKKMLRRESSKFNLQLFQISESVVTPDEAIKSTCESRPAYTRAESIHSYLGEKNVTKNSAPASIGATPVEHKLVKRESVSKLIGARPAPMIRRSSTPALPLNPEIRALMLNSSQSSFDSEDESEKKPRRIRILRRF